MKRSYRSIALATMLSVLLACTGTAFACSWAAYTAGAESIVARTMDWYEDDSAVVKGHGRNEAVKAADTPNALEYKAKYASIQVHSFSDIVIEAMNEKGLQCSVLFLEGSELPAPSPDRKDVSVANYVSYVISNFATVREVTDNLPKINIAPASLHGIPAAGGAPLDYKPERAPFHFAIADAGGDRAIIEFLQGTIKLYHGPEYDAMTNEPNYEVHLYLDEAGYQPNGTILPVDRRSRAKQYLADMRARKTDGHKRTLLAMRGLLATVNAGTEQIDQIENEVYPTIWSALADQTNRAYYISRYDTWGTEFYDFSMFPNEKPEAVTLKPAANPPAINR